YLAGGGEGRGAITRQGERGEKPREAEGPGEDPAGADAAGADGARLVEAVRRRLVGEQRDAAEASERRGQDALDPAHPAALLSPGSARRAGRRRVGPRAGSRNRPPLRSPLGRSVGHSLSHQTSRTSGITTGLRSKRWLMKRRTALRAMAPMSSRSITSGSSRAASASRTARLTSSISSSDSFM